MKKDKRTLLGIHLIAQYYKKDITDRYFIDREHNIVINNDCIDILCDPRESLYIEPLIKHTERNNEIERLNKELDKTRLSELHKEYIINELEKWCNIQFDVYKGLDKIQDSRISCHYLKIKDKLKELKEGK